MKKGQRPHGAIEKDIDKLIKDLTAGIGDSLKYLNTCSPQKLIELHETILDRSMPKMMPKILGNFAGKQSISSMGKLAEAYPDPFEHIGHDFWIKIYKKHLEIKLKRVEEGKE